MPTIIGEQGGRNEEIFYRFTKPKKRRVRLGSLE